MAQIRIEVYRENGSAIVKEVLARDLIISEIIFGDMKFKMLAYMTNKDSPEVIHLKKDQLYKVTPFNKETVINVIMGNDRYLEDIAALEIVPGRYSTAYMRDGEIVRSMFNGGTKHIEILARTPPEATA